MTRLKILDLFCGAGGATKGYQQAGFYVVGVDIEPQPNYCGDEFHQVDALAVLDALVRGENNLGRFNAVHASPPCPRYANVTRWRGNPDDHPDLIGPVRDRLNAVRPWWRMWQPGIPWVMENVRTRELRADFVLCGSMFGLPVRRHRYFETNWATLHLVPPCRHRTTDLPFMHKNERAYTDALGCPWMTNVEGRDAIPPAYTEWIGHRLIVALGPAVAS